MIIKNSYNSHKTILSKNRALKLCVRVFLVFVCVALLAPFLANDKPLVCKYKNNWLFPAFSFNNQTAISSEETINYNMGNEWKTLETDFSIFSPCAYSPNTIDAANAPRKGPFDEQEFTLKNNTTISMPFKFRHWLGTTQNGNDVLSGIVHGTKISLSVGIFSMLIASLIGISLGACAGYFENNSIKIGYVQSLFLIIGVFISYFYGVVVSGSNIISVFNNDSNLAIFRVFLLLYLSFIVIKGLLKFGHKIDLALKTDNKLHFPIDLIVSRVIEILNSIPSLLLIIALSAITKPSYSLLILIIGFLSWTSIARLTRAEYLKTKQLDYVTSCKALGISHFAIIRKHILPNVFPVILVQIIFGMAGAVLIEASLSFIGVGIPSNTVSWGSLLNEARDHFSAWWLVVFPGLCVFSLIFVYNKIASEISKKTNLDMVRRLFIIYILFIVNISIAQTPVEYYFKRAIEKDSLEDYKGAIDDYTKAISFDSSNANYYIGRGLSKHELEDYNGAIKDFSKAIKLTPKDDTIYNHRADARFELEDYTGSISDCDTAIFLNNRIAEYYSNRGLSKYEMGNYKEALVDFEKAIEIEPKDGDYYNHRGLVKHEMEDFKGSIEDYTKAINLDNEGDYYYFNRGLSKNELKDYKGAIEDFSKAILIDKDDGDYFYNRGCSKYGLKEYELAIDDFNSAISVDPTIANYYCDRGMAKEELGKYSYALMDYDKAIELDTTDESFYYNRGNTKYSLEDYISAITDYNTAIKINAADQDLYNNRGLARYQLKDYGNAIDDFTKAIELDHMDGDFFYNRALCKIEMKEITGACQDLEKAKNLGLKDAKSMINKNCK